MFINYTKLILSLHSKINIMKTFSIEGIILNVKKISKKDANPVLSIWVFNGFIGNKKFVRKVWAKTDAAFHFMFFRFSKQVLYSSMLFPTKRDTRLLRKYTK